MNMFIWTWFTANPGTTIKIYNLGEITSLYIKDIKPLQVH